MSASRNISRSGHHGRPYAWIAVAVVVGLAMVSGGVTSALAGFEPAVTTNVYGGPKSLTVVDLDKDGKLDLLSTTVLYVDTHHGRGDGEFGLGPNKFPTAFDSGGQPVSAAVADLNGDGRLDVVSADSLNFVYVLIGEANNAQPIFFHTPAPTYDMPASPAFGVRLADLNGDGKLDIVLNVLDGVSVRLGNGNGTFGARTEYAGGSYPDNFPNPCTVVDVNRDGKLDVIVPGSTGAAVLFGNGDGSLQASVAIPMGGSLRNIVVADVNGDGNPDIVGSVRNANLIAVALGKGDGTFLEVKTFGSGARPLGVALADFNGDGKLDVAAADENDGNVSILLGNADGTFQPVTLIPAGFSSQVIATGDFNGDGRIDIALGHSSNFFLGAMLNTGVGQIQFTSPSVTVDESAGTASVALNRTGPSQGQASAAVNLRGGSATQGPDFTYPGAQTVSWASGETGEKTITIPIVNDQVQEANETIQVDMTLNPSWASQGGQAASAVTITDDDVIVVNIANASKAEGNGGVSTLSFPVTLTGATAAQPVTVQFATAAASADATDFGQTSGTLILPPGQRSAQIDVVIVGDTLAEPDETFTVTLSNPAHATLGVSQAIGTIQNDDTVAACAPRPKIMTTPVASSGVLQVHVEPTALSNQRNNLLQKIQFVSLENATVTINGQTITNSQTVTLPASTVVADFTVRRNAPGQAVMVKYVVVDGCGEWQTFVGGGAGATGF